MNIEILDIIKNPSLDYRQKKHALATAAENSVPYVNISEKASEYLEKGIICDLFEGHAPYRPRYILPDYKKFIEAGSDYLDLQPPKDLYEAVNSLLILYGHVPSITGYPVFLGNIDDVLEPFVDTVTEIEFEKLMRMFLINIDRNLPDAFVHMDVGPRDTRVGRCILKLERELKNAVPNITLKYSAETNADFAKYAIETALLVGKPYFVNHDAISRDVSSDYGIASCYNILRVGGGSYTLTRMNLKKLAETSSSYEDFLSVKVPSAVECLCEIINARAKFIVEDVRFFENSFLSKEGLLDINKFTSMAGVFGLYECIEVLSGGLRMGHDEKANEMAEEIVKTIYSMVKSRKGEYCFGYDGKIGFHAQSGIDTDIDVTAGVRIGIGKEPDLFSQIKIQSRLQKYFDTGVSDIYIFDRTAKDNIDGVYKIINGAIKNDMRIIAINTSDSELVRITGYLVKRSELDKYFKGEQVRDVTTKFGGDSIRNNDILSRKVRTLDEGDR